ncbi:MAG: RNA-binding S4 domain-containing protein [Coprobacillus sp.]|nr:RNA-binding S4 domain-containing protein [Coprobacillus sp.]
METIEFDLEEGFDYIELQNFLKLIDLTNSGGEAKIYLQENEVYVNDVLESRRGRKLFPNDTVRIGKKEYLITKS